MNDRLSNSSIRIASGLIDENFEDGSKLWISEFEKYLKMHPEAVKEFKERGVVEIPPLGLNNKVTISTVLEQPTQKASGGLTLLNLTRHTIKPNFHNNSN